MEYLSKNIWLLIITILIVFLVTVGGVYTWQRGVVNQVRKESDDKITQLQQQVEDLQNQISQQNQSNQNQNIPSNKVDIPLQPAADTTGWEIYKNENYGFEVKHPPDLTAKDWTPQNFDLLVSIGANKNIADNIFSVGIEKNRNTVSQYLATQSDERPLTIQGADLEDVFIGAGNYPAKKFSYRGHQVSVPILVVAVYLIEDAGHLYQIQYSVPTDPTSQATENSFNQILDTFKFLDKTSFDPTISWETYRDADWGFQIKYPIGQGIKAFPHDDNDYPSPTIVEFRPQSAWEPHCVTYNIPCDGGWEPTRLGVTHENYQGAASLQGYLLNKWNNELSFSVYQGKPLTASLLKPISLGGVNGYSLSIDDQYWIENYVLHNNTVYNLLCLYGDKAFMDLCAQIITTFRFTK